ncbi:hypothetical protein SRHO_G00128180 [Serrasalmus rhombeus]
MYWLLRHKGTVLLLYTLGLFITLGPVAPQGSFPRLENIAAYKPVSVAPAGATCGVPERSAFCQAGRAQEDFLTCSQQFCVQECPYRSSAPRYANLLTAHPDGCPAGDSQDVRPGAEAGSTSFVFRNQSGCLASLSVPNLGPAGSFTLTVWLKLEEASVMTVFEKSATNRLVFLLTISETDVQFHYGSQTGQNFSVTMRTAGHIITGQWTHLTLQVHAEPVSQQISGLDKMHERKALITGVNICFPTAVGAEREGCLLPHPFLHTYYYNPADHFINKPTDQAVMLKCVGARGL